MASLILKKSPGGSSGPEEITLDGTPVILGRCHTTAQIVIDNTAVSRNHARITSTNGQFYLEDLDSRNHTFLNGKRVDRTPTPLRNDDKIKICDYLFVFADEKSATSGRLKPLPDDFHATANAADDEADDGSATTQFESPVGRLSHQQLLDTQPSERLRALLDITTVLAKQTRVEDLLQSVADVVFNLFKQADRCFIILTDENQRLMPKVVKTRRQGSGGDRFSRTIVKTCIERKEALLSHDASEDANLAPSASIADFRIKSVVVAPLLTADGRALGVIQLDGDRSRSFKTDDIKFLSAVATQAAVALENVRLQENVMLREKVRREVEIASEVQRGFLPQVSPKVKEYEFFAHYVPAQTIGGDYYDFISLSDGKTAILLGDVSGKSVPAALLMAKLCTEARFSILMNATDLAKAITTLNEQLVNANLNDRYVTLCATVLDPETHRITMVNAGHETPLIYRAATGQLEEAIPEDLSSFPLCWVPGNEYPSHTFELQPGDALILFTDGVNDAENAEGIKFGRDGINRVICDGDDVLDREVLTPQQIGDRLINAVTKHAAGHRQFDDIAVVVYGRAESRAGVTQTRIEPAIQ